ncbi:10897_t:CDS:2 [Paraglomus brasilianum]|uniref:10897_t:CDS:1 n=1 Tax=Paraglomus brasilianum TaxID=144538 RepID=A0A9N9FAR2_9GLOM|nr:10897_t:CDS:2 [Paraglomus brasilianum]
MTECRSNCLKAPRKKFYQDRRPNSSSACPRRQIPKSFCQLKDVIKTEDCDDVCAYNPTTVSDKTACYLTTAYNNDYQLEKYPLKPGLKQGHWICEEDKMLLDIVNRFGPHNWEKNSIYHPTRNGRQMRERWLSHLQGVNKDPFTEKEVAIVYYMRCIEQKGWADIAKRLDNRRTPNSCKNVYHNVVAKNLRSRPKSASKYETIYHAITTVPSAKEKMAIEFFIMMNNGQVGYYPV